MEFLDINMAIDSSLFVHAIHILSTGGFLKKTRLYFGFKNIYKNIPETRKLVSVNE
jgi:hypothetical protein